MPTHSRLAGDAQTELEHAHALAMDLQRVMRAHLGARSITYDQGAVLVDHADRLVQRTGAALQYAEATNTAQLLAASLLTGEINPHVWRKARQVRRLAPVLERLASYVAARPYTRRAA